MAGRQSSLQRQFDQGRLVLPDQRPASVSARAWLVLVRHVRDRVPYTALAAEMGVSQHTAHQLAAQAAAPLRYPDLADLPGVIRQALVLGGYTTREAVAQASDADLLSLKRMSAARLRAVRGVIPRAGGGAATVPRLAPERARTGRGHAVARAPTGFSVARSPASVGWHAPRAAVR
jgi:hypothetical protein